MLEKIKYEEIQYTDGEDYPLLQLFSEMIGILGSYLGISICTFAEFIGLSYWLVKKWRLKTNNIFITETFVDPSLSKEKNKKKKKQSRVEGPTTVIEMWDQNPVTGLALIPVRSTQYIPIENSS